MNQTLESMESKEILQSEMMYSQIIEYSVETIMIHLDHKILYINQAGAEFLRGGKNQIIGSNCLNIIQDDMKDKIRERFEQGMYGQVPLKVIEQSIIRCDGSLVDVEFYCHPVQFGNRQAIQTVLRDITIQKETEKMLKDRQKMVSIGEIAAGIVHEVKNPLTSVKGFLQLLKEKNPHPYIHAMESELEKAIDTLQNLLQVSKPDLYDEPIIEIDVCKELNSLIYLFQDKLYNIEIEMDIRDCDKHIFGKKNLYLKAFFNLIKNALEAMPTKGKLRIEHYFQNDSVNVKVIDTGVGIPKDKINLLGNPFYSSKNNGTGLGLTQVFTTINNHGGQMTVHSKVGQGSTFHLKLPQHPTGAKILSINRYDIQ
ncbi:PAS domain-containing sensor histidine kinase [Paenisporosarcina sp. TG20]|uniref:sensor histidine kinase n=1 Tax=Paenisporosarcina sp. TG20 TaxID=1211706 RepID=UPI00030F8C9D|nr:PAS domain-containing sensor histidine kinase [Paenisporosarcina sp. TG20]